MAKLCRLVYAFEASPTNFKVLQKNIKLSKLDNVEAFQDIINEDGEAGLLYHCDQNSGMHRIYKSNFCNKKPISVRGFNIDSWFLQCLPVHPPVNFVKMDIEGAELGALKGMRQTLEYHHPILLMEFHPPSIEEYGASPEEEYNFLKTLGYSIRLIPKISIPISFTDLEKETRKESGRNIICLPPDQTPF